MRIAEGSRIVGVARAEAEEPEDTEETAAPETDTPVTDETASENVNEAEDSTPEAPETNE